MRQGRGPGLLSRSVGGRTGPGVLNVADGHVEEGLQWDPQEKCWTWLKEKLRLLGFWCCCEASQGKIRVLRGGLQAMGDCRKGEEVHQVGGFCRRRGELRPGDEGRL